MDDQSKRRKTERLLSDLGFDPEVTEEITSSEVEPPREDGPGPDEWVMEAITNAMLAKVAPRLKPGETFAFKANGLVYTVRNREVLCGSEVISKRRSSSLS